MGKCAVCKGNVLRTTTYCGFQNKENLLICYLCMHEMMLWLSERVKVDNPANYRCEWCQNRHDGGQCPYCPAKGGGEEIVYEGQDLAD